MTAKKSDRRVTVQEVWLRLTIIISPLIGPYLFDMSKTAQVVVPGLWLVCMGPFFLIPTSNFDAWEEDAKPYHWIFQSIAKLYLGLIIISGLMYLFFGRGRY